eukprot:6491818-Amphidinium_carterae.4
MPPILENTEQNNMQSFPLLLAMLKSKGDSTSTVLTTQSERVRKWTVLLRRESASCGTRTTTRRVLSGVQMNTS